MPHNIYDAKIKKYPTPKLQLTYKAAHFLRFSNVQECAGRFNLKYF